MRLTSLSLMVLLGWPLLGFLPTAAHGDDQLEIGGHAHEDSTGISLAPLTALDLELDFGVTYTWFTGQDMENTYTGQPQLSLGISMALAPEVRTFLALRYGSVSGDPFYDQALISAPDAVTLRSAPLLIGLKVNASQNTQLRYWFCAAWMLAWVQEKNNPEEWSATGHTHGFLLSMGPEFILSNGHSFGLDLGWGGTRGTLGGGPDTSHEVDLVGYQGRLYYALPLKGDSQ